MNDRVTRLVEILVDEISQFPIVEMASERNAVRLAIYGLADLIQAHCMYLVAMPEDRSVNHWKGEVRAFCKQIIKKVTWMRKPFTPLEIFNMLWDDRAQKEALLEFSKKYGYRPSCSQLIQVESIVHALSHAIRSPGMSASVDEVLDS